MSSSYCFPYAWQDRTEIYQRTTKRPTTFLTNVQQASSSSSSLSSSSMTTTLASNRSPTRIDRCDDDDDDDNSNNNGRISFGSTRRRMFFLVAACGGATATMSLFPSISSSTTSTTITTSLISTASAFVATATTTTTASTTTTSSMEGFVYSLDWTGTNLSLTNLEDLATISSSSSTTWTMGRWPDPILRRPAEPISNKWLGSRTLRQAAQTLEQTAIENGAVGLAAQQCGINARMIYVQPTMVVSSSSSRSSRQVNRNKQQSHQQQQRPSVFINPYIVGRSSEQTMKLWTEECLVLPPTFRATLLRDDWIDVIYQDLNDYYDYHYDDDDNMSSPSSSPLQTDNHNVNVIWHTTRLW